MTPTPSLRDNTSPNAPIGNGGASPRPANDGDDSPDCTAVVAWCVQFAARLEKVVADERRVKVERTTGWQHGRRDAHDTNQVAERELLRTRDVTSSCMSKKGEQTNWNVVPQLVDRSGKFKEGVRDAIRMI